LSKPSADTNANARLQTIASRAVPAIIIVAAALALYASPVAAVVQFGIFHSSFCLLHFP
jgi:hypothetical protein